jgi:hypothetical protein
MGDAAKPVTEQSVNHFVDTVALPPAVHVGFAEADGTLADDPGEQVGVVDANVPWLVAVEGDTGSFQHFLDGVTSASVGQCDWGDWCITGHGFS